MKGKSDFIFLAILGLMILNAIFSAFFFGYVLSINSYIGIASWIIVTYLRFFKPFAGKYGVVILLIAGTLNVVNFGLGKTAFSVGVSGFEISGLDPILFVILISYCFVHKHAIKLRISNFTFGSAEDREKELQKKIDFYLKKFGDCDIMEFESIFSNLSEYPEEAQIALRQIKADRLQGMS